MKAYMQNDNVVVEAGKDCAAQNLFTNTAGQVGDCIVGSAAFTHIGIGNGSSANIDVSNQTLADATGTCASTGVGGEMARRNVTASFDTSGTNAIVTLDTSGSPFTFDGSNATSVIDSGVFNADYAAGGSNGICGGTPSATTDWDMFSRQLLNAATGITVGSGDSLSVKWTITVG